MASTLSSTMRKVTRTNLSLAQSGSRHVSTSSSARLTLLVALNLRAVLGSYLVSSGNFLHPTSRRLLAREECARLDTFIRRHRLGRPCVATAFDHAQTQAQLQGAAAGAAGGAAGGVAAAGGGAGGGSIMEGGGGGGDSPSVAVGRRERISEMLERHQREASELLLALFGGEGDGADGAGQQPTADSGEPVAAAIFLSSRSILLGAPCRQLTSADERCAGAAGGGLEVRDEELVEAQAAEAWVDDLLGGGEQFPGL